MPDHRPPGWYDRAGRRPAMTVCWLWLVLLLVAPPPLKAQLDAALAPLVVNGGLIVADGSARHRHREHDLFVPASSLKILTCLIALEKLGAEYRFETRFFLDHNNMLYIKGDGDPRLTSEVVLAIAKTLASKGLRRVSAIRLDDGAFHLGNETASEDNSSHSYDAPNGALAVNFNAVALAIGKKGKISTVEGETPFLPLMRELAIGLPPGLHRLNVAKIGGTSEQPVQLRYVAELFTAQLRAAGIAVAGPWKRAPVPAGLTPILIHQGPTPLAELVRDCLKYSNNFLANQLFLAVGAKQFGFPATWDKGRAAVASYAATHLGLTRKDLVVKEGAGLSRDNQISPAAFLPILERFRPYAGLLSEKEGVPLKSGTLTGVYCYAGYFVKDGALLPFALLLNQNKNTRKPLLQGLKKDLGIPASQS